MSQELAVRVEGLTVRYRGRPAVDQLSLAVPTGSVFGLLGENGAGKSTTIKTMLGLVAPQAGRVEVLGLDARTQGELIRRKVGYVPEIPTLYEWMTPAEIGWFAAGLQTEAPGGVEGTLARYAELIKGFELPPNRKIKALSKGMRAKVGLSLALAPDPSLLILDEPTSGLDLLVRREFLESMVDLAGSGRTVILSSHQVTEVERVASHVGLIHKGKLMLAEPLDELKARTFRLTLTIDRPVEALQLPSVIDWKLIDVVESYRQTRMMVHADSRDAVELLREIPGVSSLEVETPGLEEIYVSYMRGRVPSSFSRPFAAVGV